MDSVRSRSEVHARPRPRATTVAWTLLGVVLVAGVLSVVANAALGTLDAAAFGVYMVPFPVVGAVIAARRPANAIGWIMLTIGLMTVADGALSAYGVAALRGAVPLPAPAAALTVRVSLWVPIFGLTGTFLLLLFPDGHLPSPRWRWLALVSATTLAATWLLILLTPGTLTDAGFPQVHNPLAVSAVDRVSATALPWLLGLLPVCIAGCALSLVQRYRTAHGTGRLQLKWLASAAAASAAVYLVTMLLDVPYALTGTPLPSWTRVLDVAGPLAFLLIPAAIGVAMLRHRLYDIDVIINRALVYGALTSALTLAYVVLVTALQALLRPVSGSSDLAVAGSTLLVAAAFRPVRGRIQATIDRVFYRRRYDAVRTLEAFSHQLRARNDLLAVHAEITASVGRVMQPSHVSLWLNDDGARRR